MIPGGIPDTLQNTVHLQYPDGAAIEAAYRELPKKGTLYLSCGSVELQATLTALEAAGFYGMQVNTQGLQARHLEVRAFKGKQGPCYETGRSATYLGIAAAALDDDNHLIAGSGGSDDPKVIRVCEKTGTLYGKEPYDDHITVTEPDPAMVDMLMVDPQLFDCDTLEEDSRALRQRLDDPDHGDRQAVLYPGPFKVLVLVDGTMLRRGQSTTVPVAMLDELLKRERVVKLAEDADVVAPEFFQSAYDEHGAVCLLGDLPLADTFSFDVVTDLDALTETGEAMRERLLHLIERGDKQFVLTGSDPRIQYGCCPSDDVFAANRLAEAGILDLYRAPAPPGTCPTTIYAFRGELGSAAGKPVVTIDTEFRDRVRTRLQGTGGDDTVSGGSGTMLLRWGLLLFVGIALAIGLLRREDNGHAYGFAVPAAEQYVVAFYHPHKRCEPCEAIEHLSREVVTEELAELQASGRLVHQVIDYEREGASARDTLTLYTSMIFLYDCKDGTLLREPYQVEWVGEHALLDDEADWRRRLVDSITTFIGARP